MIFKIYLPVRNEAIDLQNTIYSIKKHTSDQIIVVDNNSTDNSIEIAKKLNLEIWQEKKIGKANVIKKIFAKSDADVIFFTDSDNTYDFSQYNFHKKQMIANNYDMIIGKRNYEKKYLKRIDRKLANKIFNFLFKILIGGNFNDICSGYRFIKKNKIQNMIIHSKNFEIETEINIFSIRQKFKTQEFEINYRERVDSISKLKTFKDSAMIVWFLIKKTFSN